MKKTVFVHIGKTGGTSLHAALAANLAIEDIFPRRWLYPSEKVTISRQESEIYNLFSGHFYIPLLRAFEIKPIVLTVIRDPMSQMKSAISQGYNETQDLWNLAIRHYGPAKAPQMLPKVFSNLQTRALHRFLYKDAWEFEERHGPKSIYILERVLRRIHQFDLIGVTNRLDDVVAVYNGLGGAIAGPVERKNISPPIQDLALDYNDQYLDSNALDIALYSFANNSFDAIWQDAKDAKIFIERVELAMARAANTERGQYIYVSGWHPSDECHGGQIGRWTKGGVTAEIAIVGLSATSQFGEVILIFKSITVVKHSIRISINGKRVKARVRKDVKNGNGVIVIFEVYLNGQLNIDIHSPSRSFYEFDQNNMDLTPRALFLTSIIINGGSIQSFVN